MTTKFICKLLSQRNTIRNVVRLTIIIIVAYSCGASHPTNSTAMRSTTTKDSMLVDGDGNKYFVKKMLDNNWWMMTNLKWNIPDSYCYEHLKENCEKYGRLYTWLSAQKACSLLGDGWKLPTSDDWLQMAGHYGFLPDSSDHRKRAYKALLYGGNSEFNAVLGGGRESDGKYERLEAHGFYWTATAIDDRTAWCYNFGKNSQSLYRQDGSEKVEARSVRCVKKTEITK